MASPGGRGSALLGGWGSADAPDATGDVRQGGLDGGAAEEPGEGGATAAAQPEAAGEFGPAGLGEQVGGGIVDGGVGRLHVGAAAGGAVDRQADGEDRHQADGGEQAGGAGELGGAQGTAVGEGAVEEVAVGHAHFQTPPVGREGRPVGRQGVQEGLGEVAAVDGGGQIADGRVGHGGHGHGERIRWSSEKGRRMTQGPGPGVSRSPRSR